MSYSVLFINKESSDQYWLKALNIFSLLPAEISSKISKVDAVDTSSGLSSLRDFSMELCPAGTCSELFFSLNRNSIGRYLSHVKVFKKIIDENIDQCMVFEDDVLISDVCNLLMLNPDIPTSFDIVNLSSFGIKRFNAYSVTNQGARNILRVLTDQRWLNGVKLFGPQDFNWPNNFSSHDLLLPDRSQDFSKESCIYAPIENVIFTACSFSVLKSKHDISFIGCLNGSNPDGYFDPTGMNESELEELISSSEFKYWEKTSQLNSSLVDCIFYINLDEEIGKMNRTEIMLDKISIPNERFSAIKPTIEESLSNQEYKGILQKSKLIKARDFLGESISQIDLTTYELGTLGCLLSHVKLLERIYSMKDFLRHVIIIEDDCVLSKESIKEIDSTLIEMPDDWDLLRSTWSAPANLTAIDYSHPLSYGYDNYMQKSIFQRVRTINTEYPSVCPVLHAFSGGTHFQVIKVESIPNILSYLKKECFLPIDSLYHTDQLRIFNKKMGVSHTMLGDSSIVKPKKLLDNEH